MVGGIAESRLPRVEMDVDPVQPGNTITINVPNPTSGRQALFADLEYEIDGIPYHLTTTFFEPGVKPPTANKP